MRGMAEFYRDEFKALDEAGRIRREGGLRIFSEVYKHREGYHHVKLWRGKQSKPFYDYLVKSPGVDSEIADWVSGEIKSRDIRDAMKAETKAVANNTRGEYMVGTLLHGSWGYDQTNCEFYEIVERPSPHFAVVRKIAGDIVPGSEGFMCCNMRAVAGDFIGEPIRKKIGSYGVKVGHACLTPTTADAEHYDSWYA